MFNKFKQLFELKKQAQQLKDELTREEVFGQAEAGLIKVVLSGDQKVKEVFIDQSLLSLNNKEKIEKGLKEAFTNALKELQRLMVQKIQSGNNFFAQL